jgi:hypothetical protein
MIICFLLTYLEFFITTVDASSGPNIDDDIEKLHEELYKYKNDDSDSDTSDNDDTIAKKEDDTNRAKELIDEHNRLEEIRKEYDALKVKEIECDIEHHEALKEKQNIFYREDLTSEEKNRAMATIDEKTDDLQEKLQQHEEALQNHPISNDRDLDRLIIKQQELRDDIEQERNK